jgi:hypothetical protein
MRHEIPCPAGTAHATVSWPELPGTLRAEVALKCSLCGYAIRQEAARKPQDFDAIVADFLARHAGGACQRHGHGGQG